MIVDYNPDTIIELVKEKIDCRYGDASDAELLDELNLKDTKMIISTIPDFDTNTMLISKIRSLNNKTTIIVVSHQIDEALHLYEVGASYVIMPHFLGGKHTSALIESYGLDTGKFLKEKSSHIQDLKHRKNHGHEHPVYEKRPGQ